MRGFGLSVDDFGTGFSNLRQLIRVPFTEIKVDQGLIKECGADFPSHSIVVESSLEMAKHLGLKTVAEGVETCDAAQGYFISEPLDGQNFWNSA